MDKWHRYHLSKNPKDVQLAMQVNQANYNDLAAISEVETMGYKSHGARHVIWGELSGARGREIFKTGDWIVKSNREYNPVCRVFSDSLFRQLFTKAADDG